MPRWRQSTADLSALPILAQIADYGGSEPKFWILHIARMGANKLPLTVVQTIWDMIARVLRTPLAPIVIKRVCRPVRDQLATPLGKTVPCGTTPGFRAKA